MTPTDINTILLIVIILLAATLTGVWIHPQALIWLSDRLYARARAVEAARTAYRAAWVQALEERGA